MALSHDQPPPWHPRVPSPSSPQCLKSFGFCFSGDEFTHPPLQTAAFCVCVEIHFPFQCSCILPPRSGKETVWKREKSSWFWPWVCHSPAALVLGKPLPFSGYWSRIEIKDSLSSITYVPLITGSNNQTTPTLRRGTKHSLRINSHRVPCCCIYHLLCV